MEKGPNQDSFKYCTKCGQAISSDAAFCPHCGTSFGTAQQQPSQNPQGYYTQQPPYGGQSYWGQPPQNGQPSWGQAPYGQQPPYYPPQVPMDAPSPGMAALGFFFPIVGLILYCIWKSDRPQRANSAGKGALAGFITNIGISILYSVLLIALL